MPTTESTPIWTNPVVIGALSTMVVMILQLFGHAVTPAGQDALTQLLGQAASLGLQGVALVGAAVAFWRGLVNHAATNQLKLQLKTMRAAMPVRR